MLAATDGHAKNFSIRLLPGGRFHLTPFYDVLSAWPVIGKRTNELPIEKVKLAMALPGEKPRYLLQGIQRRHFDQLGRRLGLGDRTAAIIDAMAAQTSSVVDIVQKQLPKDFPGILERVFSGLERQAARLRDER